MFVEVGSGVPSGTARWTPASVLADPDAGPAPLPRGANLQGPCRAPPASPARGGSHRGRRPCARVSPAPRLAGSRRSGGPGAPGGRAAAPAHNASASVGLQTKGKATNPGLPSLCPPPLPPKAAAEAANTATLAAINFYLVKAQSVPVVSIDSVSGKQITGRRVGAWGAGAHGTGSPPPQLCSPILQNTWGGLGLN